ncbi:MAG: NAD-dependent deacetylase [Burkholderiaceae bacterium]|jgi:NAD-dependent SIR2 family protein deacetylase|nr:NAD-dependent deacetylase [Burkholderiaceae bacterium]
MASVSDIETAVQWLKSADALVIAAGAGMGVDSGLPDFRGNEGFWKAYPPLAKAGVAFTQIANPSAFSDDPARAWGFYGHRLRLYRRTQPHAGFHILRALSATLPHGDFVFTSNVDGQFQAAGFSERRIIECHGSIHFLQCACFPPCEARIWEADALTVSIDDDACRWLGDLPTCIACGALARPNILMFGDWGWVPDRTDDQCRHWVAWRDRVRKPLVVELGAGVAVPSVRRFSESLDAPLIRINPTDPQMDDARTRGISLKMGALEALERIQAVFHAT